MNEAFPHTSCASCGLEFKPGDSTVHCPQCGAVYHRFCWKEHGGCTVPGCTGQAAPAEEAVTVSLPPAGRRSFPRVAALLLIVAVAAVGLWLWQHQHRSIGIEVAPRFVFQASFNGMSGLMTMHPGEKTPRQLLPIDISAFAVRPGGEQMAVVHYGELQLVGMDGKPAQKLGEDAANVNPVFTPDNTKLIYATYKKDIVVRTLDGSAPDTKISAQGDVTDLVMSPDGRTLAYIAGKRLYQSAVDGGAPKELARGASSPIFTADGTAILYIAKGSGDRASRLYRIGIDGSGNTPLTEDTRAASNPVLDRDGRWVACIIGGEVAVISPAGENVRYLTQGGSKAKELSFSSDGKAVVFTNDQGMFSVPLAGGKPEQLLTSPVTHPDLITLPVKEDTPTAALPAIPDGYALAFNVNADFDGDGKAETAYGAASIMPADHYMPELDDPPTYVLVAKDGKVIYREKDTGLTLKHLVARDLTGDGTPELIYTWESMGGSDGVDSTYVFQWKDGKFRNIIGNKEGTLSHFLEGGLVFQPGKPGKPSTLVLYDFIWAEDESHADPHRYWAEWYTLKQGKFALSKRRETKKRYYDEDPMAEFGQFTGERY